LSYCNGASAKEPGKNELGSLDHARRNAAGKAKMATQGSVKRQWELRPIFRVMRESGGQDGSIHCNCYGQISNRLTQGKDHHHMPFRLSHLTDLSAEPTSEPHDWMRPSLHYFQPSAFPPPPLYRQSIVSPHSTSPLALADLAEEFDSPSSAIKHSEVLAGMVDKRFCASSFFPQPAIHARGRRNRE